MGGVSDKQHDKATMKLRGPLRRGLQGTPACRPAHLPDGCEKSSMWGGTFLAFNRRDGDTIDFRRMTSPTSTGGQLGSHQLFDTSEPILSPPPVISDDQKQTESCGGSDSNKRSKTRWERYLL